MGRAGGCHRGAEWRTYSVVPVVRRAGALAERHALRGYDAVQLAAAIEVRRAGANVEFASFDTRLSRAARRETLRLAGAWGGAAVAAELHGGPARERSNRTR